VRAIEKNGGITGLRKQFEKLFGVEVTLRFTSSKGKAIEVLDPSERE